ncbi:hypothetical protein [Solemya elarraichensis gill symbiont]|nr:hypothetical protein [Solemya elarraichensis gill symbiont]
MINSITILIAAMAISVVVPVVGILSHSVTGEAELIFAFHLFPYAYSIIPIVLIDTLYLNRTLGATLISALKNASISNLVSAIIIVPMPFFIVYLMHGNIAVSEYLLGWLAFSPSEDKTLLMILKTSFASQIPFFFIAWRLEVFVTKKRHATLEPTKINGCVRNANLLTFSLQALVWPFLFGTMFIGV